MSFNWFARSRHRSAKAASVRSSVSSQRIRPKIELLEDRLTPAVVTVTSVADNVAVDGMVTLREALTSVNAHANVNADVTTSTSYGSNDVIKFKIPGSGVQTIFLATPLPDINQPVSIDGYSQSGTSANTSANGDNAVLKIAINGGFLTSGNGLTIRSGGSIIQGLNIRNFSAGAGIYSFGIDNGIYGNFIGTNETGTTSHGNKYGIILDNDSGTFIGQSIVGDRNIISGNTQDGIQVLKGGNLTILNNYIGTDASSSVKLGNTNNGIEIDSSSGNSIGLAFAGSSNVIGGNGNFGIYLDGATSNAILSNSIGVSAFGSDVGNGNGGIGLIGTSTGDNSVGGTAPLGGNRIAFNGPSGGIRLFNSGGSNINNRFSSNSIYANQGAGIQFGNPGVVSNDVGDADGGPNNLQNFPVLTAATSDKNSTTIAGSLNSNANGSFRIEFFSNPSPSTPQVFLGSEQVHTDSNGNAQVFLASTTVASSGTITATATDAAGNTSQFAVPIVVMQSPVTGGNVDFLAQAYLDILHRQADAGGLQYFKIQLANGVSRTSVVQSLQNNNEYRTLEVTDLYNRLLNRAADAGGLASFVTMLSQGGSVEQVEAILVGSPEYYQMRGASTVSGFLAAAYGDLLGRQPDAGGAAYFTGQIALGTPRATVAGALVSGMEGSQRTVDQLFQQYLHRSASAADKSFFGSQLQSGLRDEQLIATLAASDEYFTNAS
jgi:Domain of unknown function (DUF4214)